LILKKIMEKVGTRGQILWLKCTKFDFGWGSAPDPAGGAHSAPPDPQLDLRGLLLRERREGEGRGRGKEGKEEERTEGDGKRTPLSKCLRTGMDSV